MCRLMDQSKHALLDLQPLLTHCAGGYNLPERYLHADAMRAVTQATALDVHHTPSTGCQVPAGAKPRHYECVEEAHLSCRLQ